MYENKTSNRNKNYNIFHSIKSNAKMRSTSTPKFTANKTRV